MKKLLKFSLAAVLGLTLLGLAGCGKKTDTEGIVEIKVDLNQLDQRLERLEDNLSSLSRTINSLKTDLAEQQTQPMLASNIRRLPDSVSDTISPMLDDCRLHRAHIEPPSRTLDPYGSR